MRERIGSRGRPGSLLGGFSRSLRPIATCGQGLASSASAFDRCSTASVAATPLASLKRLFPAPPVYCRIRDYRVPTTAVMGLALMGLLAEPNLL